MMGKAINRANHRHQQEGNQFDKGRRDLKFAAYFGGQGIDRVASNQEKAGQHQAFRSVNAAPFRGCNMEGKIWIDRANKDQKVAG